MRLFVGNQHARGKARAHLALAIALVAGTATGIVGFAEPAHAAKKEKKSKASYSKEFIEVYQKLETAAKAEGADIAALSSQFPGLVALSLSPDEQLASGNLIYNTGAKSGDHNLQLQGMELMLASGQVPVENQGQYNFVAYQLANASGQYSKARQYIEVAMQQNFSSDTVTPAVMKVAAAETFFSEQRVSEGLDYLKSAIKAQKAAGLSVDESWYTRGLAIAYRDGVRPQVYQIASGWVVDYPSTKNWRDAVNIARNLENYEPAEMLDLMRLGFVRGTFENKQSYIEYVEAADPRRMPKEVQTAIEHGYATGRVSRDDIFLADALKLATSRIASDKAELPALERDARAASAGLKTVMAAGDTFLNYADYAKAEEFYAKAAGMAGADVNLVKTRLGISQALQGKYVEAEASLAGVQGARTALAMLWTAYVREKAAEAAPAVEAPVADSPAA